jgi:circadian clock protein KaiB
VGEGSRQSRGAPSAASDAEAHAFRLYIAGTSPNSRRALANLKAYCGKYLQGAFEIDVVDVFRVPRRALDDGIVVTPTLLRLRPTPVLTLIGDLADEGVVRGALGVHGP